MIANLHKELLSNHLAKELYDGQHRMIVIMLRKCPSFRRKRTLSNQWFHSIHKRINAFNFQHTIVFRDLVDSALE